MFHCADPMADDGTDLYYESIDLEDAFHPQTILAYDMNDAALPIANGAPIRLRVERQLGYKHAKYVMRIELVRKLRAHRAAARAATGKTRATSGSPASESLPPAHLVRPHPVPSSRHAVGCTLPRCRLLPIQMFAPTSAHRAAPQSMFIFRLSFTLPSLMPT